MPDYPESEEEQLSRPPIEVEIVNMAGDSHTLRYRRAFSFERFCADTRAAFGKATHATNVSMRCVDNETEEVIVMRSRQRMGLAHNNRTLRCTFYQTQPEENWHTSLAGVLAKDTNRIW